MTVKNITKEKIDQSKRTRTEKPEPRLKPRVEYQDLCSTCSESPSCINRTTGKPVHHCDDYENHPTVDAPAPSVAAARVEPVTLQGLCVNCIHKDGCVLAGTQGGVWHCEEYE
jgi:hypothetical protein